MKRKRKPERQAGCDSNCYHLAPELGMCRRSAPVSDVPFRTLN